MGKVKNAAKAATDEGPRKAPFVLPWLLPVVLLVAGSQLHNLWGRTLPWAAVAVLAEAAAAAVLCGVTWRYALPRGTVIQWHSTVTVGLSGAALIALTIFGAHRPLVDIHFGVFAALALSWNVRRMEAIKGEGLDAQNKGVLAEMGLAVKSKKVVTQTPDRFEIDAKMGDGQTATDVQKVLDGIGSRMTEAGTPVLAGSMRAVPGRFYGEVKIAGAYTDVLAETLHWPGPTHPGGSVTDGLHLGKYEDSLPIWVYPFGNYELNIAPGHTASGGITRSGKGECTTVKIAELSTRRDVVILLSDTRKGDQFLGDVRSAVALYFDTPNRVKAMLKGLERAGTDRNKALGAAGYKRWTPEVFTDEVTPNGQPGLRMPALAVFMEEAAADLNDNATLIVELGEFLLSAGIVLFPSAQRWTHDRAPTSFRSNIGNAVCFGTGDAADAGCLLTEATLKAGPDPFEWKARYPGRLLVEGNGIDAQRFPVPGKGYLGGGKAVQVIAEWGPRMAGFDPVTVKALGADILACTPPTSTTMVPVTSADIEVPDDDEEEYMVPTMSEDPDLAAVAAHVDPRAEIPEWDGPDVDLNPEPQVGERVWSKDERREEFSRMVRDLQGSGKFDYTMAEMRDEWTRRVGRAEAMKRTFLHELVTEWIDLGQIERLSKGRYRLAALVTVGDRA